VHNHLIGGGFGRRLEFDMVTQAGQNWQTGVDVGQGRLDARRRHSARHVPAVLLRQDLCWTRRERQTGRVAAPTRGTFVVESFIVAYVVKIK
jgi:hypothetical protein